MYFLFFFFRISVLCTFVISVLCFLFSAGLARVQLVILPLLFNELFMGPPLNDAALLQYNDAVTVFHRGQPVGDDEIGPPLHQGAEIC